MYPTIRDLISAVPTTWRPILQSSLTPDMETKINQLLAIPSTLPQPTHIFEAFHHFDITETHAVIIGMDVYPTKGHGTGLCFSVPQSTKPIPPSLRNIIKELENEYYPQEWPFSTKGGDISHWARHPNNVLMINTALTVQEGKPGSHISVWHKFTTNVIAHIAKTQQNIVYMLWGNHAKEFASLIDDSENKNLILTHTHPSPLSRKPFIGNGHFKACNEYLISHNKQPIEWFP